MMSKVIQWIKDNPIIDICVFVALLGVLALIALPFFAGSFREQVTKDAQVVNKIRQLRNTRVELPPETPDGQPRSETITINPTAIATIKDVYSRMQKELVGVTDAAEKINRQSDHVLMMEGLFPEPKVADRPFIARGTYRTILLGMLEKYTPNALYPRLDAAPAPEPAQVQAEIQKLVDDYLRGIPYKTKVEELNASEVTNLEARLRKRLVELLKSYAERIHIYAETDPNQPDFPFTFGAWSMAGTGSRPPMDQIWEGQMEIWIISDIVRAIAMANEVDNANRSVLNVPVKRLVSVRVLPGYVGIDSQGGLATGGESGTRGPATGMGPGGAPGMGPGPGTGRPGHTRSAAGQGEGKIPDDFKIAPTGRRSNAIYDVRHAQLVAVVDSRQLPALFEALARVNFMTVLKVEVKDVDEYQALQELYVYGNADVVQVTLLLETLWFRNWTLQWMPQEVKEHLGIQTAAGDQTALAR